MLFSPGAFIEKAGTGGGLFRRLLAQGAFEIAQMTGDEATTSSARSASRAAEAWTTVARSATARDKPARSRVRDAAQSALALPELERSEEHTSELQSLMRISYAVFCLKKKKTKTTSSTAEPYYTTPTT